MSFAQNFEDVVLWRTLRHVEHGTYIDVGTAHPVDDSVSAAFFDRGWIGVHIETEPARAELLRRARPGEVVIEAAAERLIDQTVDVILQEVDLLPGKEIHFMRVAMEGFAMPVLRGANLGRWRPWILIIEVPAATRTLTVPQAWEDSLEKAGYSFVLYDGVNRFYLHEKHAELRENLSYPACRLDEPFIRWRDQMLIDAGQDQATQLAQRVASANASLSETRRHNHRLKAEVADLRSLLIDMTRQCANLDAELAAMTQTRSWRVTRPLRRFRGLRRRPTNNAQRLLSDVSDDALNAGQHDDAVRPFDPSAARNAFVARMEQAAELLTGSSDVGVGLAAFERASSQTSETPKRIAWLGYVAATGRYPDETTLAACARRFDAARPGQLGAELDEYFEHALRDGSASLGRLDVVRGSVLIDVTHTAQHDLHTGIQRVVREVCERWFARPNSVGVWWDYSTGGLRRLGAEEMARFRDWRSHVSQGQGIEAKRRSLENCPDDVVVPWQSALVLPELVGEPERTAGYRCLAVSGNLTGISMVGYDLIPLTAAETVAEGMPGYFSFYLSLVKYATKVSTISETTAIDFRAFTSALGSQGLTGPEVQAHLLPASGESSTTADLDRTREIYQLGDSTLVLVVGSHEPRKNHMVVLAAAERLWNDGHDFRLVFIGGSGWRGAQFDREVDRLHLLGKPVVTRKRASEAELWAAYRLARFSVFPSLLEGFGLPIVESMACGTPVITSNYGAMAEVAAGGGALTIDPRSVTELTEAMRLLLQDDELVAKLSTEAANRQWPDWSEYADRVWQFLTSNAAG